MLLKDIITYLDNTYHLQEVAKPMTFAPSIFFGSALRVVPTSGKQTTSDLLALARGIIGDHQVGKQTANITEGSDCFTDEEEDFTMNDLLEIVGEGFVYEKGRVLPLGQAMDILRSGGVVWDNVPIRLNKVLETFVCDWRPTDLSASDLLLGNYSAAIRVPVTKEMKAILNLKKIDGWQTMVHVVNAIKGLQ